jgi:hypothetical protein
MMGENESIVAISKKPRKANNLYDINYPLIKSKKNIEINNQENGVELE